MNFEDCLKKGLIRKDIVDINKSKKSLETADHKLDLAKRVFESGIYEEVLSLAYNSMFHSVRALLFKDGFTEKSHFGLFIFLKEKYSGKIEQKYISEFNNLREDRHDINYGIDKVDIDKEEASGIIFIVKDFLELVKKQVK